MDALRIGLATVAAVILSGCQVGYLFKAAKNHFSIMSHRVSIDEALKDPRLNDEQKAKLKRAAEAHDFAIGQMHLHETANYTTYVHLDRPYVSYVVSAAPRWKLEHHTWWYPFVGTLPYRGFAAEDDAKELVAELKDQQLDTYMRGVSAYSTLGWFKDSILSSMLAYREHDLVNTIIHETTHTTLFIKGSADFNERLAVFVGNKGMEQFYVAKEGADSPTLKRVRDENADDRLFSGFIGPQLEALKKWYAELPEGERSEEKRQAKFQEIKARFKTDVEPKLKSTAYKKFPETELNNARLLYFKTYMQDLGDFEKVFDDVGRDWPRFLACAKTLEKEEKPEEALVRLHEKLAALPAGERDCQSKK